MNDPVVIADTESALSLAEESPTIAAVDLGSNSFHMIVAHHTDGRIKVIDRMREPVRLAAGLDSYNRLSGEAIVRAVRCLERFGERIRALPRGTVRVVGTNTLRKARNGATLLAQAEAALGHPIDIISGHEEARLIYLGVSHGLEDEADVRLVFDIGGGSTEFIVGRHFEPIQMESLHMGCVSMSAEFFSDGRITEARLAAAVLKARQELEPIEVSFRRTGWDSVIGASGTSLAVRSVVQAAGWCGEGVTVDSLRKLRQALLDAGHLDSLTLDGLSDERRPVFAGGVAIMLAVFEALGVEQMRVSESALREGLLYDLIGRISDKDVREQTVVDLVGRYRIDSPQGERVAETARLFLEQTEDAWELDRPPTRQLLRWSSQLHELGQAISHSQYHKHGSYLLMHLDMPGFARGEQRRLAALVRGHRRKVPLDVFQEFAERDVESYLRLCVLLRIAVVLHRRRTDTDLPGLRLKADDKTLKLRFADDWLVNHPLTRADLEQEAAYLKAAGFKLKFK